jgi:hypothetical protein
MDIKSLTIDPTRNDGVWAKFEDAELLIRPSTHAKYLKAIQRESRKHQPHKVRNDIGIQTDIAIKAAASELLLDFKGITEGKKVLENTQANREKLMSNPIIREFVSTFSQDVSNFQAGGEAEDASDLKSGD